MLLAVGERAYRELDGCWFECTVVASDKAAKTLSVQYCDDQRIEQQLEPQDVVVTLPSEGERSKAATQTSNCTLLLSHCESESVLRRVLEYLDQFQWIRTLALVQKSWLQEICRRQNWSTIRLPNEIANWQESRVAVDSRDSVIGLASYLRRLQRLMNVDLERICGAQSIDFVSDKDHLVRNVAEHLVFNDCNQLHDADILQFVRWSRHLTRISLRRCSKITFVLLYELIRITKDKRSSQTVPPPVLTIDVWLCQGIPAEFVQQLQNNTSTRQLVRILGPGGSFTHVSAQTLEWLDKMSSDSAAEPNRLHCNGLLLVPKDAFKAQDTPQDLVPLKPQVARFPLTVIPVIDRRLSDSNSTLKNGPLVLIPTTVDDFVRLVNEFKLTDTLDAVQRLIASSITNDPEVVDLASCNRSDKQPDDLELRAQRVFAMLHKTTQDLENQVAHLEKEVKAMALAKDAAQKEYSQAQNVLDQIAKDANRAILSLATGSLPPPALICNDIILKDKDGDELLPPLPSLDQIDSLGHKLEVESFAVLDSFLGAELSSLLRMKVDELYETSMSESLTKQDIENQARFTRGELAGGKTGQSLRYQMAHVRGDYVLWIDEFDLFCPPTVQQVLRQLDRLVLERLPRSNAELRRTSLMRKKAMITCYPGHQTRYTKHCDNPNQNGRKVSCISSSES